jgi:hypothetical protein
MRITILISILCIAWVNPVWASGTDDQTNAILKELRQLREVVQKQNETIQRQQRRIEELERKMAQMTAGSKDLSAAQPVPSADKTVPLKRQPGDLPGMIGSLIPEIGLVGDITATLSEEAKDTEGNDRISAREIELVIGGYVDPYSRFDVTVSSSDFEEPHLEEAYLTRWGLPWDLTARFGRFFPQIGKQAAIHRDSLPTVDEPLVVRRYFGEEGFRRAGVDVTRIFESVGGWLFQPFIGILEGGVEEGGSALGETRRRPTIYSHLKTYKELSDVSGIELGMTHMIGSRDDDPAFEVNIFGLDATYLTKPTPTSRLLLQSEVYLQNRREDVIEDIRLTHRHPWGIYLLGEYRFHPQWGIGLRGDHVWLVDASLPRKFDQGVSAFLTFYQSEWARWRLQFRHEERANEDTDDAVFLQGTFAIGTHKHKLQ